MCKRITAFLFSLVLVLTLVSPSRGFDANTENFILNQITDKKEPLPYTPQNIQSGLIKGGHDTLTAEGMELKKKVHQNNSDFQTWAVA